MDTIQTVKKARWHTPWELEEFKEAYPQNRIDGIILNVITLIKIVFTSVINALNGFKSSTLSFDFHITDNFIESPDVFEITYRAVILDGGHHLNLLGRENRATDFADHRIESDS